MQTGERFGRWSVVSAEVIDKKVLCRCDCGTERYVLERSLKHGGSQSCGCLRRERSVEAVSHDLTGQTFGELTVLKRLPDTSRGGVRWLTKCSCGNEYEVLGTLLVNGRRTHCASEVHKQYPFSDISGRTFGRLTAIRALDERDKNGYVMWHCVCSCGNEIDVSYNSLLYSNMQSCGCMKKEHSEHLKDYLTHVAGTSVDILKSKKVPSDNTTGYKGVYLIRGKYVAKIVFQKKAYNLGSFDCITDAAEARKEAEELLFDGMAKHYEMWKVRAEKDPQWAEENPVEVIVNQRRDKKLSVSFLPDMSEMMSLEKYMKSAVS
ncbi:MAG: hypothetical protein E7218_03445 [Anaerofustis stercorihominis]|nr:hypothetical protein [Anaerofustis stercorihominis]